CATAEEIAAAMIRVIDEPGDPRGDGKNNQTWMLQRHSADLIVARQLLTYSRIGLMRERNAPPAVARAPEPAFRERIASQRTKLREAVKRWLLDFVARSGRTALKIAVPLGRWATRVRLATSAPRSLWGVTPILTLPLLARCDGMLGFKSRSLVYVTYYISKNFDIDLSRLTKFFQQDAAAYRGFVELVLAYALLRFDVFSYFYDRGVLSPPNGRIQMSTQELALLKASGKRIYAYAYGADVRTREKTLGLGAYNFCVDCDAPRKYCICSEEEAEQNIEGLRPYANAMIAMGDMIHYVPGCRNFHYWPIDCDRFKFHAATWRGERPLRILHAPNHMHFKGSRHLFSAIERLKAEGAAIELKTISGVPNDVVLAEMAAADVVAEQFIGGAIGYTAVEAFALGKPVLTYVRDESAVEDYKNFPGLNASPDRLYDMLKDVLDGRPRLAAVAAASRRYAEAHYSLEAVALKLGALYLETAGLPKGVARRIARRMERLREALDARLKAPL
ncbi:MAG: glycosyltransferase, partial [Parvularculaceae bacterium]|nr:glycosyltransferase [Parvularculaceae bacterium]